MSLDNSFELKFILGLLCLGLLTTKFTPQALHRYILIIASFLLTILIVGGPEVFKFYHKIREAITIVIVVATSLYFIYRRTFFWTEVQKKVSAIGFFLIFFIFFEMQIVKSLSIWKAVAISSWSYLLIVSNPTVNKAAFLDFFSKLWPAWNVQLFGNLPTESKGDWSQNRVTGSRYYVVAESLFYSLVLLFLDKGLWLVMGYFYPESTQMRKLSLKLVFDPGIQTQLKVILTYVNIFSVLFSFGSLTYLAHAAATAWGFKFKSHLDLGQGFSFMHKWNYFFFYLNQIIEIVFMPLFKSVNIFKSRRANIFLRMCLSVYAFGFLYLLFLINPYRDHSLPLTHMLIQRFFYLTLICLFLFVRFRFNLNKVALRYPILMTIVYILVLAPVFTFGIISVSGDWFAVK